MWTILTALVRLVVLRAVRDTGAARAQLGTAPGYNPYTGYRGREAEAYNPYTGTRDQSRNYYNPCTEASANAQRAYNPYTGRSDYRR